MSDDPDSGEKGAQIEVPDGTHDHDHDHCFSGTGFWTRSLPKTVHLAIMPHPEFTALSTGEEIVKLIISFLWLSKTGTAVGVVYLYQGTRSIAALVRTWVAYLEYRWQSSDATSEEKTEDTEDENSSCWQVVASWCFVRRALQILSALFILFVAIAMCTMRGCSTREGWTDVVYSGFSDTCKPRCSATCTDPHPYRGKYFARSCDDITLISELRGGFRAFSDSVTTCPAVLEEQCDCRGCSCHSKYSYFHNGGDPESIGPHVLRDACYPDWEIDDEQLCHDGGYLLEGISSDPSFLRITLQQDDGSPRCYVNDTGVYFNPNSELGRASVTNAQSICLPPYFSMSSGYCRVSITSPSECADAYRALSRADVGVPISVSETSNRQVPTGCSYDDDFYPLEQLDVVKVQFRSFDDRHTLAPCTPRSKCICKTGLELKEPPVYKVSEDLSSVVDSAATFICLLMVMFCFVILETIGVHVLIGGKYSGHDDDTNNKNNNSNNDENNAPDDDSPSGDNDKNKSDTNSDPCCSLACCWTFCKRCFTDRLHCTYAVLTALGIILPIIVFFTTVQMDLRVEEGYVSATNTGKQVILPLFFALDILLVTMEKCFLLFGDAVMFRFLVVNLFVMCVAIPGVIIVGFLEYTDSYDGFGGGLLIRGISGNSETIYLFSLYAGIWACLSYVKVVPLAMAMFRDEKTKNSIVRPLQEKLPRWVRYGWDCCNHEEEKAVDCPRFSCCCPQKEDKKPEA